MRDIYGFEARSIPEVIGLGRCFVNPMLQVTVAEVTQECYQQFTFDPLEDNAVAMQLYELIRKHTNCGLVLLMWKEQEEDRLLFLSNTKRVRAIEFMDYMIAEFGLVKGNAAIADGRISSAILKVQMSGVDMEDAMEYFMDRAYAYFTTTQIVEAGVYGRQQQLYIENLPQYVKKKIAWAYVRSTDIVAEGESFQIRSLENESGITLTAHPDCYIMIGCRGEAYDITRQKFECTYEPSEDVLDIFEQMLDFIPEAKLLSDGSYVSLDELAHLCYPKQGNAIYAVSLDERTKVFPVDEKEEYYLGRPGDYMAIRSEDLTDIYIIQKNIFHQTYEQKESMDNRI